MGSLLALSAVNAIAANTYIYKDKDGQVLKTNINPSGDYDKFNKTLKRTYHKNGSVSTGTYANSSYAA